MNTKIGQLLSTLIIVGLAFFWSASILAAESSSDRALDPAEVSIERAADANEEAAEHAVKSIAEATKVELDRVELEIRVIDPNSLRVAAD